MTTDSQRPTSQRPVQPVQPERPAAPRHILLTGASSGIGHQAAFLLRQQGHRLTLPCRDGATAAATLARLGPGPVPCEAPVADLADRSSVAACARALLERGEPLDTLVLNAGLQDSGARQPRRSAQGHELTMAVNHLAHLALVLQLLPLLDRSPHPRVVITASEVHDPTTAGGRVGPAAHLGDLAGLRSGAGFTMADGREPFDANKAYKDSKLANLLMARELDRRLRQRGTAMAVIAWSPGLVIPRGPGGFFRSSQSHNPWGQRLFALIARDLLRLTASVQEAGRLLAALAASDALIPPDPGFQYWSNRVLGPGRRCFGPAQPSAEARDDALAQALWEVSAELMGLPPALPPLSPSQTPGP